ncbi:MAG: hypothetical protein ACXWC3_15500 [Burkholderiales bacterium]
MRLTRTLLYCTLGLATSAIACGEVSADLQRLQRERTQQQLGLQLKMQQQQDRASRPADSAPSDLQRRQVELQQQQRQREIFEEEARATVGASQDETLKQSRATANERTGETATQQLQRFERDRGRSSSVAPAPRTSE